MLNPERLPLRMFSLICESLYYTESMLGAGLYLQNSDVSRATCLGVFPEVRGPSTNAGKNPGLRNSAREDKGSPCAPS